ncbi:hypothetical protein KL86PLE_40382 [uncultured Pleomorphomonas sp.]|uniref:Uncharacterized protein n=1 Tax=uncultured Pleomorphomonas sp. TaxID=442121 RepID=A0A212LGI4_9HYPH|nr:hypothetical protein KL86PLE_40382 [uncultured Pleomorphomonas sp.]
MFSSASSCGFIVRANPWLGFLRMKAARRDKIKIEVFGPTNKVGTAEDALRMNGNPPAEDPVVRSDLLRLLRRPLLDPRRRPLRLLDARHQGHLLQQPYHPVRGVGEPGSCWAE